MQDDAGQHDHGVHEHGHEHQGHRHHHHGDDFDWEALADSLELDAAITLPIVDEVVHTSVPDGAAVLVDVGCGPGVVALHLAASLPGCTVTALDSSQALLERVRHRAVAAGLGDRVRTVLGDLEQPLPTIGPADLVWASMVVHHVADPVAALSALRRVLRPGGTLVMIEFGSPPEVLSPDDPLVLAGAWQRFEAATAASLRERLGLDPVEVDWPALLAAAGYTDVVDTGRTAVHRSPLGPTARAWLVQHVRRGIEMAGDRVAAVDVAALNAFADSVPSRDDLTVRAHRRVITATAPAVR